MKYRAIILFLYIAVFSGCASTNLQPITANRVSFEEDEKRLWLRAEEEAAAINKSGFMYKDGDIENYLTGIAKKLQPQEVTEQIPFRVSVLRNPHLNAFAFPNGVIYVHTGILSNMDNEAQLATLLAHEMTHSTHRHALKNFRDFKNKTDFLATFQVASAGLGAGVGNLVGLMGALGTMAAVTGYSRDLESEADAVGLKLMADAGYDPYEAPKLFNHLKKEVEEEDMKEPFFFGSHPRIQERIDNYRSLLDTQYVNHSGGEQNTAVFLDKISGIILDNAILDLKAGRFKAAQRGVEKYLTIRPDDAKAYFLMGELSRQKNMEGDVKAAQSYYEKAVTLAPAYSEPYKGLGMLYFKSGEKNKAREHFKLYLSLAGQTTDRAYIEEYINQLNGGMEH